MTDLTAAVEAAARALFDRTRAYVLSREGSDLGPWAAQSERDREDHRQDALAAVAAAAPILRAQVLTEAREAVAGLRVDDPFARTLVDHALVEGGHRAALTDALAAIDALGAEGPR